MWNDDLDLDIETIYYDGHLIKTLSLPGIAAGEEVQRVRAEAGLSQKELADLTGIDQSDISKIERGASNPTLGTLERIANALGGKLVISIETEH
ncbi:MAG: helix-turn-helix transcriptional regulator [Firmicutes bacterium]|nr:helix-turn-helix transcriptional regulator [Bacillota bacterium]MBR3261145.1 helix-turn-helix transcriptional regulator [Bacillota bacterium]MBR6956620.1 helix-turn-helix transcriptional regulator [Bacillota bacterium]